MKRINSVIVELDEAERAAYVTFHDHLDEGENLGVALAATLAIHQVSTDFATWLVS